MPGTTNDDLLTIAEVAALLDVSRRTVERLKAAGELPYFERGLRPRILFRREDVLRYARGTWYPAQS